MKQVFFFVYDVAEMVDFCRRHSIQEPKESANTGYYYTDFDTWRGLFINLPYSVGGCFEA